MSLFSEPVAITNPTQATNTTPIPPLVPSIQPESIVNTQPDLPSSTPTPISLPYDTSLSTQAPTIPNVSKSATPLPNSHPMQTRSKHGIFKPKTYYKAQLDYTHTQSHLHSKWKLKFHSGVRLCRMNMMILSDKELGP